MRVVFADTSYLIAVANQLDDMHDRAFQFANSFKGEIVTTEWVLAEFGDSMSKPRWRSSFLATLETVRQDPDVTILEATHELFERAVRLFANRPDKSWSVTDCTSFLAMEDLAIGEALTDDHHFAQAGFIPLLA